MKCFIVLSALVAVALAKPGYLHGASVYAPVAYAHIAHGAPLGVDGRVVDTPEVAHAKAEHAAAHINEKVTLAHEAAKSYDAHAVVPAYTAYSAPRVVSTYAAPAVSYSKVYSAPAVSYSKVYSAVAPVVSSYSSYGAVPAVYAGYYGHGAPVGLDGHVVDTPEVAHAKAAHFAAHAEAKARLGYGGHYGYGAHYGYAAPAVSAW